MAFTERERFIANCDRVTNEDSIDSNCYLVTITTNAIVVDSVKNLDQCNERDINIHISMIQTKIEKRRQNDILYGIAYMESYIDKIITMNLDRLLLASTKFRFIEFTLHHCTVMMNMHRWTKRPKTMYEAIRIMVCCVYQHWKLTLDAITILARVTDSNQHSAFFAMGFRFTESHEKYDVWTLDWKLYTQMSQTPSRVEYIFK